ncbi:MAG: hypothetical protein QQN41_11520, partial [Nitrosopumilus sp.]
DFAKNLVPKAPKKHLPSSENTDDPEIKTEEDGTQEIDVSVPPENNKGLEEDWNGYKANKEKNETTANYFKDKIIEKIGREKFEIESKRDN